MGSQLPSDSELGSDISVSGLPTGIISSPHLTEDASAILAVVQLRFVLGFFSSSLQILLCGL